MNDFTLKAYQEYLLSIKENIPLFLRFDKFMSKTIKLEKFCLIRHDVDRKPINALEMAELEHLFGIKSTYYFRYKSNTFKPDIIKKNCSDGA